MMFHRARRLALGLLITLWICPGPARAQGLEEVNTAELKETISSSAGFDPAVARAQVLLDRQWCSPGPIDGVYGSNTRKALRAYQQRSGLEISGELNAATWESLTQADELPAVTTFTLTSEEVDGPFAESIPEEMEKKAELEHLSYTSATELLAEKFHMAESLLRKLNPDVKFDERGTEIAVAQVRNSRPKTKVAGIVIDKASQALKAFDAQGKLIAYYPATVGSSTFPSPIGSLKVVSVAERPTFTYSSELAYSDLPKGKKLVIAPGPNNPVGLIWIGLSQAGYGIHGSPMPERISKQASHGCVRLTNWDAQELAHLVSPGVPVRFSE